jgi:AcrR family transcriptional regulator
LRGYESTGRSKQKQRTRDALKVAAGELIAGGDIPTVAEVAERAAVSRATAYRYFPNQDALIAEVLLDQAIGDGLERIDEAARAEVKAEDRLASVVTADHDLVTRHEATFRTAIRSMMIRDSADDASVQRRPGNRLRYLAEAVRPVVRRLGEDRAQRLVAALAMVVGIESVLVTKDICGLDDEEAVRLKQWAAGALLAAALAEAAVESAARGSKKRES